MRLAAANARRNPQRVAATTAALTIGLTLMTAFTSVISSAQATSVEKITQQYPFDYVVQAGPVGGVGSGGVQLVPQRVVSVLTASPALGVVAPTYDLQATVNGAAGTDVGAIGQGASVPARCGGHRLVQAAPVRFAGSRIALGSPGAEAEEDREV